MSISNTEHEDIQLEIPKQTILNSHIIFLDNHFEDLLFPDDEMEKWKIKLEIIRSKADDKFEIGRTPARRPVNDQPLHEVYKNIMNKSSFPMLTNENNANNITSAEMNRVKTFENNTKPISIDNTNNVKKSDKPLEVRKSNGINDQEADINYSKRANTTDYTANINNTFQQKKTQRSTQTKIIMTRNSQR